MGIFNLFKRSAPFEQRAEFGIGELLPFSGWNLYGFGSTMGDVGVEVTPDTALAASSVFAATSLIASTIASLPLHVYDRESGGKVYDHPIARLVHEPNDYMTAFSFWESVIMDILTRGNLYSFIERTDGEPTALYPLPAASTSPKRQAGELLYGVWGLGGGQTLRADEMLHVPFMPINGIVGRSPLMIARRVIGLSLAIEQFVGKFFANGCHLQGIMELPAMSKEAREQFTQQLKDYYTGVGNAWKMAIPAVPGAKYHATTSDPEKAQMMQARVHQIREVARVYRIPPHMLGDLEKASYASIEMQSLEFSQYCIQPWAIRIEQELNRKLIREDERGKFELRYNFDALLRTTTKERYDAHAVAVGGPFMSVNEARKLEGLPPVPGGDSVLSPLNSTPTSQRSHSNNSNETQNRNNPTNLKNPTAVFDLIEDAARRLITKERHAIMRAASKYGGDSEGFKRWADEFYAGHAEVATRTYTPIAAFVSESESGDIAGLVDRHITRNRDDLIAAIDEAKVNELLARWESDRPGELAEEILNAKCEV